MRKAFLICIASGLLVTDLVPLARAEGQRDAADASAQVVLSPTRYDLNVEVDYAAEAMRATARIEVENPSARPVRTASLLLYRLLRVQAVRDEHGRDLAFGQTVVTFEDFRKYQANQILVTLAAPLAPRARTTIQIRYEGPVLGYAETGMRYIQDRIDPEFTILRDDSLPFPQPGYPSVASQRGVLSWSFTYSARITVPNGLVVANGGRLDGIDPVGDKVAYRYSSLKPSWRMDFAIAKYKEVTASGVRVFHLPGDEAGAASVVQAATKAVTLFTGWYGPRRGSSVLTFIEIPDGWGSQTDVTAVIQAAAAFRDPTRLREVYHEISHLWNAPSTESPKPRWEEGLASFLEYLVTQEITGEPAVERLETQFIDRLRRAIPKTPGLQTVPLVNYGGARMTNWSYTVGGLFFDLLYRVAGKDTFHAIIGRYSSEFAVRGGSTKDLVDVISRTATQDLSSLVNDWLYTTAWTARIEQHPSVENLVQYYRQTIAPSGGR